MDNNLNEVMKACIGACLPCIALTTTETNEIINRTVEFAVKHESRAVYVWRESIGFQEYAPYMTEDDGTQRQLMSMDKIATDFNVKVVPGKRTDLTPDEDFPGATVPFAVEFIDAYDGQSEGRGAIFILRDWHRYVNANADHVDKQLALFEALSENPDKLVIALAPVTWDDETTPIELDQYMYRAGFDMPNKADRLASARHWHHSIVGERGDEFPLMLALDEADLEAVADATGGLTHKQVEDVLCMSISTRSTYDLDFILGEKQYLVKQAGFEIQRPKDGFERIGGLTPLKTWAGRLRKRFSKAAFDYGFLAYPRGLLMAGVPGCGKSAIAKSIANEWGMNLLTVQATDLKGSLVGESEAKVGRLLRTASAAAPIIVFVDEAEKLLGKSEGIHDGGAHDAILGQFLSFMQDDRTGVFFVFTANNMEKFAPELVDRFEGRFFIDLPSTTERKEILKIHLTLRGWDIEGFNMDKLVKASKDFSGRNIEDAINEAMGNAFSEDRKLSNVDLLAVFEEVIPTSKTKKTEIETMRTFVENGMMRSANDRIDEEQSSKGGKQLRSFA
jgi:ATP-dependent 26S proteasome regulatory subunit